MERGRAPIAACTVALGIYANIQKNRSFRFNFVLIKDNDTPNSLNNKAPIANRTAGIPADKAYRISTDAPTSTNKNTSAATQSLLYFPESLWAKMSHFCVMIIPKLMMARSPDMGIMFSRRFCNSIRRNEKLRIINNFTESLI